MCFQRLCFRKYIEMNIYFNSKPIAIEDNICLHALLTSKDLDTKKGIAVAVNNTVVGKQDWRSHILKEDDNVLVISATKGG